MTIENSTADIISARLGQADGVLAMLVAAGDGDDFGTLTHKTIMSSLWAIQELIGQSATAALPTK